VEEAVSVMVPETVAFAAGRIHVTEGGVRSAPVCVVPVAIVDDAEIFPTLSWASTYQKYAVEVARPESTYARLVVVAMSGIELVAVPRWMA